MKAKMTFAKAMLQAARLGATRATDAATRQYAAKEEARWEREIARLERQTEQQPTEEPATTAAA